MRLKLFLIATLLTSITIVGFAQYRSEISPNVQQTHADKIEFFDTWNDTHLLLTASKSEIILWNTQTGLQLRTIDTPHPIVGATFSDDGKEIAVLMYEYKKDASLRFYNVKNGKALDTLAYYTNNTYNGIYYKALDLLVRNKRGSHLLVKGFNEVFIVEAEKKKQTSEFKLETFDSQFAFSSKEDEIFMVSTKATSKVAVINSRGDSIKPFLFLKEQIRSIASDGTQLYLLGEKGEISILNNDLSMKDKIITKTEISKYLPPILTISDNGKNLVVPINNSCTVYNLEQKSWNSKPLKIYERVVAITSNASQLAVMETSVNFIQTTGGIKIFEQGAALSGLAGLSFNQSGNVLSSGSNSSFSSYSSGINLITGGQLAEDFSIKQWITDSLVLCTQHKYLASGDDSYEAQIRNVYSGTIDVVFSKKGFPITEAKISPDKRFMAFLAPDKATLFIAFGNSYAKIKTIALKSKNTRKIIFSPNSNYLCITGEQNVSAFDIAQNKWIVGKDEVTGYGILDLAFTPDSKAILYSYSNFGEKNIELVAIGSMIKQMDLSTGDATKLFDHDNVIGAIIARPNDDLYAIAYLNGRVEVRKFSDQSIIFKQKLHNGFVTELLFSPKQNWLISAGWDKQLVITDYKASKQIAKAVNLFAGGSSGIGLFTPENYYMVPANNVSGLHYVEDLNTYSFKQFDYRFNRPDKVLQKLGSADTALINSYKKAYEKRIKKLVIDTTLFTGNYSVPVADFSNRALISFEQKDNKLALTIKGFDKNVALDRLNVWVNEVPIYGLKGISLKSRKSFQVDTTITLVLSFGNNKIETSVININGIESYRLPLNVNYVPDSKPLAKMHFVGIGINEFAQRDHNLQWSVKDIRDLAIRLQEKYGANIEIDTLFDSKVTKENILALKAKLKDSEVDDKVIIAYSGHGLLSSEYDYFLSTYNVDFNRPEKNGLAYDSFEDLVDDIPARQKLMLIDACHSGEVDKEELLKLSQSQEKLVSTGIQSSAEGDADETSKGVKVTNLSKNSKLGMKNSFELMQELFANIGKGTGATIISAAGGMQFALEKNSLKNGVFTYSILEYMKQQKTSGIKELKDKVNARVVELTAGMQQPTSRSENNVIDWIVW